MTLKPCPNKPNCVSTQSDDPQKKMDPILFSTDLDSIKNKIKSILSSEFNSELIEENENYLHFVVKTKLLRFRDDVEFLIDDSSKLIHFRSASRLGYRDFDANRKRMAHISSLLS